mgnify:CR=1 FL=1
MTKEKQIFYCDAIDLLTPLRFDISAKHYYAKYKNIDSDYPLRLYKHHLEVWNNFSEFGNPDKQNADAFVQQFHSIIASIESDGFDEKESTIPVSKKILTPLNGAHRIGSCILYDKKVACHKAPEEEGQLNCSYYFFNSRDEHVVGGLNEDFADTMALNYAKLKKNTFIITLFPTAIQRLSEARDIIINGVDVVYEKPVSFTEWGPFNFVQTLYHGEEWAGNWSVGFQGLVSKTQQCYNPLNYTYVFLVQTDNPENLRTLKENTQ